MQQKFWEQPRLLSCLHQLPRPLVALVCTWRSGVLWRESGPFLIRGFAWVVLDGRGVAFLFMVRGHLRLHMCVCVCVGVRARACVCEPIYRTKQACPTHHRWDDQTEAWSGKQAKHLFLGANAGMHKMLKMKIKKVFYYRFSIGMCMMSAEH